jgi:hypothetical protein
MLGDRLLSGGVGGGLEVDAEGIATPPSTASGAYRQTSIGV